MKKAMIGAASVLTAVLGACTPAPPQHVGEHCTETHKETIVTYPNMGLQALGPQYLGLALMPVYVEQETCVRWEKDKAPNAQVTGRPPAEGGESDELGEHDGR